KRAAEGRLSGEALGPGVGDRAETPRIPCPARDETPAHEGKLTASALRPDHHDRLTRRDVEARRQPVDGAAELHSNGLRRRREEESSGHGRTRLRRPMPML